ncbi:MAG TPA: hypothetical protein ENG99_01355 [bacterium]|nr:hypothetical protein [bacterium]
MGIDIKKNFRFKNAFWTALSAILMFPAGVGAAGMGECTEGQLCNPLKVNTVTELIKAIANIIFKIGFIVSAIFIILSGLKFITARGNPDELKKAKSMFMWTILGTAILLGAVVIADVIQTTVQGLQ